MMSKVSSLFSIFVVCDFTILHHRIALRSLGSLDSQPKKSQFKSEASHHQEMPVVLARYRIHTFGEIKKTAFPEQHDCPLKIPHPIFYIKEDMTHVLHPSFQSSFFHLFYHPLMNLIRGQVIKNNCAQHPHISLSGCKLH